MERRGEGGEQLTTPGSLRYSPPPGPVGPIGAKVQEEIDRLPEGPSA